MKLNKTNKIIWNFKDYLIFFLLIPLVNIIIFFLPITLKESLMLNWNSPTILNIFISNYLHRDLPHLILNLICYLIIMFLIFNLETTKKRLYSMLIIGLFAIPFILFAGIFAGIKILILLKIINKNIPPGLGFSGIVCFFLGYLLFVSYEYCKTRYYSRLRYHLIYIVLIPNIVLWLIFNNLLNKNIIYLLLITTIVLEVALVRSNFNGLKKVYNGILLEITTKNKQRKINWYKFIIFILVIAFNLSLTIIIPKEIRVKGIINTPVHFLGYLLGIFIPFIFLSRQNYKTKSKQKNSNINKT